MVIAGRIIEILVAVIVAALVLSIVILLAVTVLVVIMQRSNMAGAAGLRRFIAWVVRRSGHPGFRRADERRSPDEVGTALAAIRTRDEGFDEAAVCDAALRAAFFTQVLATTGDRQRLEQVATPDFWTSPMARNAIEHADETRRVSGGAAILGLGFQAGNVEVVDAVAGEAGTDRVTVRVAYRTEAVARGAVADRLLAMQRGGLAGTVAILDAAGQASSDRVAQWDITGWVDWELVRPVGERTGQRSDDWRCGNCGAPYRSDLDVVCPACRTTRATPEGAWRAGRTWLIEA